MAEFSIIPQQQDIEAYFRQHPEALTELRLITLSRMYSELLEECKGPVENQGGDLDSGLRRNDEEESHG